ncbi:MAG: potassium channel family protein, partial [Spirosomataceae bacterium]
MAKKQFTGESLVEKEQKRQDLGFGTKVTDTQTRMIRSTGDFNVKRIGQSFSVWFNSYHRLITMHWAVFIFVIFFCYFLVNLAFAFAYFGIGIENLNGVDIQSQKLNPFWSAFFFSSQTLTTVGYGHISPSGGLTRSVAAIEALLGLMMFAIITGLLSGRFATPRPRISFSQE